MATSGLKEMGQFLWEGREKSWPNWLSQFSFAKLRQRNFPISFKPKVAITEFFWKMQKKPGIPWSASFDILLSSGCFLFTF